MTTLLAPTPLQAQQLETIRQEMISEAHTLQTSVPRLRASLQALKAEEEELVRKLAAVRTQIKHTEVQREPRRSRVVYR